MIGLLPSLCRAAPYLERRRTRDGCDRRCLRREFKAGAHPRGQPMFDHGFCARPPHGWSESQTVSARRRVRVRRMRFELRRLDESRTENALRRGAKACRGVSQRRRSRRNQDTTGARRNVPSMERCRGGSKMLFKKVFLCLLVEDSRLCACLADPWRFNCGPPNDVRL